MDMRPEWIAGIRAWADRNENLAEVWLFGSRAKGTARPDSDVDLGVVLLPPDRTGDWPLGSYYALGDGWQRELASVVGRHVSLQQFPREGEDIPDSINEPLATAIRIWPPP